MVWRHSRLIYEATSRTIEEITRSLAIENETWNGSSQPIPHRITKRVQYFVVPKNVVLIKQTKTPHSIRSLHKKQPSIVNKTN